jgi:hypothetical protein
MYELTVVTRTYCNSHQIGGEGTCKKVNRCENFKKMRNKKVGKTLITFAKSVGKPLTSFAMPVGEPLASFAKSV